MKDKTWELAEHELLKYGLSAELIIEKNLSSFEIRRENNSTIIAAPDSV